ncbi:23128_t:CDS:2 [Entrophospora sp. SA101]|nr:20185_t:CDS:2 [Entrophospora sp. SA101]CAJ0763865.1 23128_t:CDS:2 [Entrophospora sp. SA101]
MKFVAFLGILIKPFKPFKPFYSSFSLALLLSPPSYIPSIS